MMEQPRDNRKQEYNELVSNPFVNLFQTPERAAEYRDREHSDINQSTSSDATGIPLKSTPTHSASVVGSWTDQICSQALSDLFQRVFLITVSADHEKGTNIHKRRLPKKCVYLKKTASDAETNTPSILSWSNIDEALLERLAMTQPRSNVVIIGADHKRNLTAEVEAGEVNVVKYLYSCYRRACDEMKKAKDEDNQELLDHVKKCTSLCVSYTGTTLLSPEMFPNQDPQKHIFSLLMSSQGDMSVFEFMKSLIETHPSKDDLEVMFSASFSILAERSKSLTLQDPDVPKILDVLSLFSKHKQVLELIVKSKWWLPPLPASLFNSGNTIISGRSFEKASILGPLLSLSCISADSSQPSQYFLRPADQNETEMQVVMKNLRSKIDAILDRMTGIVLDLLKSSPLTKHEILHWIGRCLHSNLGRKQMMAELFETAHAHDGFFLNLSLIMLKLCMPFMDPASPKLLKIDPCYCAVETSVNSISNEKTSVHVFGMETETRLTLLENEETGTTLKTTSSFGFVTEIFFMTHRCLQLGLWRVTEKYKKLMTELAKMQQVYQDASSQGAEGVLIERLKVQFENKIIRQLALKTHLLNPTLSELALKFYITTASWLNQVALAGDDFKEMMTFRDVTTGLPDEVPKGLVFVPEFIIDNMADYIIFLRHFDSEETLESAGHSLHHLVTFFVLYLGSRERVKNPHLRAKLAEALEAIIPNQKNNAGGLLRPSQVFHFHREHAFAQHKVAPKFLPVALLRLFVDIEFTGHSMQFEQKFGYRHHMYTVLKYLWGHDNYKDTILEVSKEVEHASMMSEPPLFMRFINLLINDAIFLLDEALQYMEQIKTLQQEKDDGNWESLDEEAKRQKLQDLQQASVMARSHNILANETVQSLAYITVDITKPFVTACMIERVAAMLNYFLAKLVGPKMGKLKVKNFEEFNFKPQQLVSDIVDIYLNLGRENNFCKAVANDERSYHPSLFSQAERVLRLIARSPDVRFRLNEIAQNIAEFAQKDKIEEQNMPEPPDEFLDPIMNTVMEDPVLLPTSGNIVDRRTIARHLLSDEKDPFSRASLSLDMVVPQNELKMRIQRWRQKLKSAENEQ